MITKISNWVIFKSFHLLLPFQQLCISENDNTDNGCEIFYRSCSFCCLYRHNVLFSALYAEISCNLFFIITIIAVVWCNFTKSRSFKFASLQTKQKNYTLGFCLSWVIKIIYESLHIFDIIAKPFHNQSFDYADLTSDWAQLKIKSMNALNQWTYCIKFLLWKTLCILRMFLHRNVGIQLDHYTLRTVCQMIEIHHYHFEAPMGR